MSKLKSPANKAWVIQCILEATRHSDKEGEGTRFSLWMKKDELKTKK